jgi:ribosomal protein L40E
VKSLSATYRVVIKGVNAGFSEDLVIANLSQLFKVTEDQIRQKIATSNFVVKRAVNLQDAAKYQEVIEQRGCICIVEPESQTNSANDKPPVVEESVNDFCGQCGAQLPAAAKFCSTCGAVTRATDVSIQSSQAGMATLLTPTAADQIRSWGVKQWAGVLFLVFCAGSFVYRFTHSESVSTQNVQVAGKTANTPKRQQDSDALERRCISQAKSQGYRNGQCAYDFINTCIRTQSRSEMEAVLRADLALGVGPAFSCPNMPSTYAAEFDRY